MDAAMAEQPRKEPRVLRAQTSHPEAPPKKIGRAGGARDEEPQGAAADPWRARKRGAGARSGRDRGAVRVAPLAASGASTSSAYFEAQHDAWCGLHALNNYLGGPYVTEDACERAAWQVVLALSQAGAGEAEAYREHLHPGTGFRAST